MRWIKNELSSITPAVLEKTNIQNTIIENIIYNDNILPGILLSKLPKFVGIFFGGGGQIIVYKYPNLRDDLPNQLSESQNMATFVFRISNLKFEIRMGNLFFLFLEFITLFQ